jgi:hypothetical protein
MPRRFGYTSDDVVRRSPSNAVTFLWTGAGKASVMALLLPRSGSALVVPDDATLLLMGVTSELTAELHSLQGAGIDRFTVPAIGAADDRRMIKVAARRWTTEGGDVVGVPHKVSIIALHSTYRDFDDEWTQLMALQVPPTTIASLLDELPKIREL